MDDETGISLDAISESDSDNDNDVASGETIKVLRRRSQLPVRQETDDEDEELNGSQLFCNSQNSMEEVSQAQKSGTGFRFNLDSSEDDDSKIQSKNSSQHRRISVIDSSDESVSIASDSDESMDSDLMSD